MSGKTVLLEVSEGIARLRLNRPQSSNALDAELLEDLVGAVRALQRDPSARAVLLSGEGDNFCAGGDVKDFAARGEDLPQHLEELTSLLSYVISGLVHLSAPVIALVQGAAAGGGGLGLVCACDLVLAGPRARFTVGATRVGMAPDAGLSVTLTRLVGLRQALRLALTNATLDAHEALELGIVSEVMADDAALQQRGLELASELAAGPPFSQAATKRLLWRGAGRSLEDSLPDEVRTVSELAGTADAREGLAAVIDRRPPRFQGR